MFLLFLWFSKENQPPYISPLSVLPSCGGGRAEPLVLHPRESCLHVQIKELDICLFSSERAVSFSEAECWQSGISPQSMVCLRWRTNHWPLSPQRGLSLCLKKPADSPEFHFTETYLCLKKSCWPALHLLEGRL